MSFFSFLSHLLVGIGTDEIRRTEEKINEDDDMDLEGDATAAAAAMAKTIKQPTGDDDLSAYDMDNYDEESKGSAMGAFSNVKGLTYYGDNANDPYISLESVRS